MNGLRYKEPQSVDLTPYSLDRLHDLSFVCLEYEAVRVPKVFYQLLRVH